MHSSNYWWSLFIFALIFTLLNGQNKSPNILLILLDDLGNADASFNFRITNPQSTPPILTPNIDKIAENGIIFTNHYTQTVCGPTRCALLTARFSFRLGNPFPRITGNDASDPESFGAGDLGPEWKTFVHQLTKRGYRNHMIGKYGVDNHNRTYVNNQWIPKIKPKTENPNDHKLGPLARGFDTFYGFYGSAHNHFSKVIDYNGKLDWHLFNETHIIDAPTLDVEPQISSTHIFTREAINKLSEHIGSNEPVPFFIYLSYSMPHDPLLVDDYYIGDKFPHCRDKVHYRRKLYCGMVANVDEGIGNITTYMKKHNLMDNTIIIFSSDNGGFPMVGGFNYPYRGAKGALFDGGMRTPSFIYAPFYFKETSKKIYDGLIHIVDWGPTLLSIVDQMNGIDSFKHDMGDIDGIDLSKILSTKDFVVNDVNDIRTDAILDANGWTNSTTFIYNDYKLILGYVGGAFLWKEPIDEWTQHKEGMWELKVPDIYNSMIQRFFGPDYWFFEWSFVAVSSRLQDYFRYPNTCNSPINRHPNGWAKGFVDRRPLYMPVSIDWNDELSWCLIRLYKTDDVSEENNIAFENKDIVEEMVVILNERLKIEEGRLDLPSGLMYGLYTTFVKAITIILSVFVGINILVMIILYKCCCSKSKQKKKKD